MSRIGKYIKIESRLLVARELGKGKNGGRTANGYEISFCCVENILCLDSSDDYIAL